MEHQTVGFGRKIFCSNKCLNEFNSQNSSNDSQSEPSGANQSSSSQSAKSSGGGVLGGLYGSMSSMIEKEEAKTEARVDQIASLTFGNSSEELSENLNQLVTIAGGKPNKDVKKAIYEKMEFGIMKLNQLGATAEADFFEKKRKDIKPKWWD